MLHRQILGCYLSGRVATIRSRIEGQDVPTTYSDIHNRYWEDIAKSGLAPNELRRLKGGETLFYDNRKERLERALGEEATFVSGIVVELSTYVHAASPSLWFNSLSEGFDDSEQLRDKIAVWLCVASFYFARSIDIILRSTGLAASSRLAEFLERYKSVFDTPNE